MKIEIAPGYTWEITYQWEGDDGVPDPPPEVMIAAAVTIEDALKEARWSLDAGETRYNILGVVRRA